MRSAIEIMVRPYVGPRSTLDLGVAFCAIVAILNALVSIEIGFDESWKALAGKSRLFAALTVATTLSVIGALFVDHGRRRLAVVSTAILCGYALPLEFLAFGAGIIAFSKIIWKDRSLTNLTIVVLLFHCAFYSERLGKTLGMLIVADASAVSFFLTLVGVATKQSGEIVLVAEGVSIEIVKLCASLWPALLVLGALSFFVSRLAGIEDRTKLSVVLLSTFLVVNLNWIRLGLMTFDQKTFEWIHDGSGAEIFRFVVLLCIVVPLSMLMTLHQDKSPAA